VEFSLITNGSNAVREHMAPLIQAASAVAASGFGSHILFHLLQHRRQLPLVVTALREFGGHDDLRIAVHGDLRIVRLHKTPFAPHPA